MAGPLAVVSYAASLDERPRTPFVPRRQPSPTKFLERRLVRIWKRATKTVRRKERASILPDGFVLLNAAAARRRSLYINSVSI
ncbi:hypothetical protein EDB89DRAFT_2074919 [Lactarius sanguifluus]|nr:hypothetical protein EDB89DRAFT_2074919 [Lactarius sanguifluus]